MEKKKVQFPIAGVFVLATSIIYLLRTLPIISSIWSVAPREPGLLWNIFFGVSAGSVQDFWWVVSIVLIIALCVSIFMKRRDLVLAGAVVLQIVDPLKDLWNSIPSLFDAYFMNKSKFVATYNITHTISGIAIICGVLLMALMVVAHSEGCKWKLDLLKAKQFTSKYWYLPGALYLLGVLIRDSVYLFVRFGLAFNHVFFEEYLPYVFPGSLLAIGYFCLSSWIKDPWKKEKPVARTANTYTDGGIVGNISAEVWEGYCELGKHILLSLFTCGIWPLVWIYRTTKFLNKAPYADQHNPTKKLLLCIFVPCYQIYWYYKQGQRIDNFARHKKLNTSDMATLCLILGVFVPIVANILMQDRINAICYAWAEESKKLVQPDSETKDETDELKKYKKLLDEGIITQEEYDAKKKQLLGL